MEIIGSQISAECAEGFTHHQNGLEPGELPCERLVPGNVPSPWKTRDRGVPKAMPVLGVVWEMTSEVPSRYRESPDVSALAQVIK